MKIFVDDTVRIKLNDDVFKIVLITRVNQTTINTVDVNEKKETFFIKEIVKVITRQKKLPLEFEEKSNLKQLTLF